MLHPLRAYFSRFGGIALALTAILLCSAAPARAAQTAEHWPDSDLKLLGAVGFQGSYKSLPKWVRILREADAQVKKLNACDPSSPDCPPIAKSWQAVLNKVRDLPKKKQLQQINLLFNKWPYKLDMDNYGVIDYWATPKEFLKSSGDCEDYSIVKFYALKSLGYDSNDLRLVVLWDTIRNLGHAVLAVYAEGEIYILDNVSNLVFPHTKYKHYNPQYSVNEHYRWAHVKKGAKKKVNLKQLIRLKKLQKKKQEELQGSNK